MFPGHDPGLQSVGSDNSQAEAAFCLRCHFTGECFRTWDPGLLSFTGGNFREGSAGPVSVHVEHDSGLGPGSGTDPDPGSGSDSDLDSGPDPELGPDPDPDPDGTVSDEPSGFLVREFFFVSLLCRLCPGACFWGFFAWLPGQVQFAHRSTIMLLQAGHRQKTD